MQSNLLPEIVKRSQNGPYMKESDFEMALAKCTARLVRDHGLKFDPQVPVPSDDDMADRLYRAGVELFVEMGAYNRSAERRILFSRDEVEELIAMAPSSLEYGKLA